MITEVHDPAVRNVKMSRDRLAMTSNENNWQTGIRGRER